MEIKENYVFPIYIKKHIIEKIEKICKKNKLEVFGYLVGERYSWNNQGYIILNHSLYLKGAVHSDQYSVHERGKKGLAEDVEFEFNKYSEEFDRLKEKEKNPNLLRLGWWHSHPNFGCFLSSTDLTTQHSIFNENYHVALVVDPIQDNYKFFTLDENAKDGYKELSYAIIS
ncbi:MAG: hypothetical protein GF383_02440 [Candidatus Lokiarchaeota archaeon]|nr:hypothetical protein [Candidatus Lokiarchaeota archaeon]MBD3338271.1 hypothetical protein [Candidatus Lokiarchaeota archaeon]